MLELLYSILPHTHDLRREATVVGFVYRCRKCARAEEHEGAFYGAKNDELWLDTRSRQW
jgi:hypothetical protein